MLRTIGEHLAEQDHDIHIFSTEPSYRELEEGQDTCDIAALTVKRIRVFKNEKTKPLRRIANTLFYVFGLFIHTLKVRPDIVTASTFPPVVAAWAASLAAKISGAKFIYHMQDIHPEVSQYAGGRLGRGLAARCLRTLDNQTLKRAAAIVTLSEDMAKTLRARNLGDLPIHLVDNLTLDTFGDTQEPPDNYKKKLGTFRIIFAGNIGRYQNLPALADGIGQLFETHPHAELFFLGDGAAKADLVQKWGDHPQVKFAPFMPYAKAKALITDSDLGLVSLAPDIYRVAYPSKFRNYIQLGLPVLALVEPESQMAEFIRKEGLGVVPASQASTDIAKVALEFLAQGAPRPAADVFQSQDDILKHWDRLIARLS